MATCHVSSELHLYMWKCCYIGECLCVKTCFVFMNCCTHQQKLNANWSAAHINNNWEIAILNSLISKAPTPRDGMGRKIQSWLVQRGILVRTTRYTLLYIGHPSSSIRLTHDEICLWIFGLGLRIFLGLLLSWLSIFVGLISIISTQTRTKYCTHAFESFLSLGLHLLSWIVLLLSLYCKTIVYWLFRSLDLIFLMWTLITQICSWYEAI